MSDLNQKIADLAAAWEASGVNAEEVHAFGNKVVELLDGGASMAEVQALAAAADPKVALCFASIMIEAMTDAILKQGVAQFGHGLPPGLPQQGQGALE